MQRTCMSCASIFEPKSHRGRPRKFCYECRPQVVPKYIPVGPVVIACAECEARFEAVAPQRYCSPECRRRAAGMRWRRRNGIHPRVLQPCGTVAAYRRHLSAGETPCAPCRAAKGEAMHEYIATVKERDGTTPRVKYRKTPDVHCPECGERLRYGGGGAPAGVEPRCLKCSRNRPYIPRSVRLEVFDRDGYDCQLCGEPTEPESDPWSDWYPTLDHIVPVSLGGGDERPNLRTAHRWCNLIRGVSDSHELFEKVS